KDGENAVSGFDADEMTQAKGFLNALLPEVETANLDLQIKAQEELIAKAEKKYKSLQSLKHRKN
ncbi:MAG TPA: hypothetical protein VFD56_05755, partial [Chitinophagaceae bacterium]|nr:hypothetical protein [Chitinophagaceae bacterium]